MKVMVFGFWFLVSGFLGLDFEVNTRDQKPKAEDLKPILTEQTINILVGNLRKERVLIEPEIG